MNTLIANPTVPQVGEPEVQRMTDISNAAIAAFHLLWDDPETRVAKLAVMGTNAVAAFEQHLKEILDSEILTAVQQAYDRSVDRLRDAAMALPYEARVALIEAVEAQLS